MSRGQAPVVVGVDGSAGSRVALEWAWAEAARRGARLDVVSAFPVDDYWTDPLLLDAGRAEAVRSATAARLRTLVEEVRAGTGGGGTADAAAAVDVEVTVVAGAPAEHLLRRSEGAGLLVVGSRGRGGVRSTLLGSVALHCSAAARCPVVVVHPAAVTPPETPPAVAPVPRVVVGLDDTAASQAALTGAVEVAEELGAELEAVIAVQQPVCWGGLDSIVPVPVSMAEVRTAALARARELVAEAPGGDRVPVRVVAVLAPAAAALVERSAGAALLVVGSRSRNRLPGMLLGSVSLHCVVHAPCPVMVVHPPVPGELAAPARTAAVPVG
jgi:nucleotide-binding universal stress UspA family protein